MKLRKSGKERKLIKIKPIRENHFIAVILCVVLLAFLFILIARLTGIDTVEDTNNGFFASIAAKLSGLVPILAIPGAFLYVLIFLLPGYITARQFVNRDIIHRKYLLILSACFSALIAYGLFWAYYITVTGGRLLTVGIYVLSAAYVILRFKQVKKELLDEDFKTPLILMLFTGCIYLSILFLYKIGDFALAVNSRFLPSMPPDNIIPFIFYNRVFYAEPLTDFLPGWLASDRPPLAAAMLLDRKSVV